MEKLKKATFRNTAYEKEAWEAFRSAFPSLCCVPFAALADAAKGDCGLLQVALWVSAEEALFPDARGTFEVFENGVKVTPFVGDRYFELTVAGGDIVAVANYEQRPSHNAAEKVIDLVRRLGSNGGVSSEWA